MDPRMIPQKSMYTHLQPPKSHRRKLVKDNIQGITGPAIRRLARRGGVKRMKKDVYDEMRVTLERRLRDILHIATSVVENARRKTVTTPDVVFALRRLGTPVYGFGER